MKRLFVAIFLAVATVCLAADFWLSKPYTQWAKIDVDRMMTSSPWAQTVVLRTAAMVQIRRQTGTFATGAGEGEGMVTPEVSYAIALRTARPIREAVVRQAALDQKYDQMDAVAKAQFDQKWTPFIGQQFPDRIIFHVKYSSNTTDVDRQLAAYWQTRTLETMLSDTFMNGPDGERVAPVAFWVGKGASREFQLAFSRPKQAPKKSSFSVEFRHPDVIQQPSTRITARFNIKDLEYKDEVTF